jgi:hypothetical protein
MSSFDVAGEDQGGAQKAKGKFVPKVANCQPLEAEFNKKVTDFNRLRAQHQQEWILECFLPINMIIIHCQNSIFVAE